VHATSAAELARTLGRPVLIAPHRPIDAARPLRRGVYVRGTVILDLGQGVEHLRDALDKRWRNALSKAERSSIGIRDGTAGELYGMLEPMAVRKGFRVPYSRAFVEALAQELGNDLALRVAEVDGMPVAAWAEARVGSTATYLLGVSTQSGRKVNAAYALAWDAVARGIARDVRFIDLGGADPDAAGGPDLFKLRTGGEVRRFPGTYLFGRGPRRPLARLVAAAGARRAGRDMAGPRRVVMGAPPPDGPRSRRLSGAHARSSSHEPKTRHADGRAGAA
jgi:lipid II:glycine glycyltransferase (peptidoglycan interpeptide bridge formation enzyme)